jgi:hypothetical protein
MNVVADCAQVMAFIILNRDGFVTALKEVPYLAMSRVESGSVGALQPSHSIHEVTFRSLEKEMVVVAHENIAVDVHSRPFAGFLQGC